MHTFKVQMSPPTNTAPLLLSSVDRIQAFVALAIAVPVLTNPMLRVRILLLISASI